MGEEKPYKADYAASGAFEISKPKRKEKKLWGSSAGSQQAPQIFESATATFFKGLLFIEACSPLPAGITPAAPESTQPLDQLRQLKRASAF